MMTNPHDVALFSIIAVSAVGALLMADAADDALRGVPEIKRRRAALLTPPTRMPAWARPVALHCVSLGFLSGMAVSGAVLVGAF